MAQRHVQELAMAIRLKDGIIRQLRDERGWSQDDLAKKTGLNKQSIFRIEKGEKRGPRPETITKLCKAFEVEPMALTGSPAPRPSTNANDSGPVATDHAITDRIDNKSQLNLRVDNAARNALTLAARRYGVQLSEIVELAPFLFFLVAERSLQRRRERVAEVSNAIAEVESLRERLRYLPIDIPGNDDQIVCEEESIQKHDIFARIYGAAANRRSFRYVSAYEDGADNPFSVFVKEELEALKKAVPDEQRKEIRSIFAAWQPDVCSSPRYRICLDEVIAIVGVDEGARKAVLSGEAPLHEIPKEMRNSSPEELGEWAKAKADENERFFMDLLCL
jgi:transcriptional regulator with XRE-family HTH domain